MSTIRPYRPTDLAQIYEICVRTAAAGGDATGIYSSDDLMPDVFAGPYVELEPELAFVVDVGDRISGYILGVADTRAFVERVRREWVPAFAERYPNPSPADAPIVRMGLEPERMLIPELDSHPAHLHIDLLPELQGQGLGRTLIDTLCGALRERGIGGIHLSMDAANLPARAFYDRLGFTELPSSSPQEPRLGLDLRGTP